MTNCKISIFHKDYQVTSKEILVNDEQEALLEAVIEMSRQRSTATPKAVNYARMSKGWYMEVTTEHFHYAFSFGDKEVRCFNPETYNKLYSIPIEDILS